MRTSFIAALLALAPLSAAFAQSLPSPTVNALTANTLAGDGSAGITLTPSFSAANGTLSRLLSTRIPGQRRSIGDVNAKIQAGTATTICAQGDSLTYGQDTSGTGTGSSINGATQARSPTPYPESLANALSVSGITNVTVTNRGYPGDSTVEGLTRWASASACDLTILMYGSNDANNYGGYPHGQVSVAQYRTNMIAMIDRLLTQGSAVAIMTPPNAYDATQSLTLQPYASEARRLAAEYGLLLIDAQEQTRWVSGSIWTDGVHLVPGAYLDLGYNLAALILRRGEALPHIGPGTTLVPQTAAWVGGTLTSNGGARTGVLVAVAAGATASLPVYAEADAVPVLTTYNTSGAAQTLTSYYDGGNVGTVPAIAVPNPGTPTTRSSFALQKLPRGYRLLALKNTGSTTAYIETIRFATPDALRAQTTPSRNARRPSVAGMNSPRVNFASGWWAAADYSQYLNSGSITLSAQMTLDGTVLNGLTLVSDQGQSTDYLGAQQIIIGRSGTSLVIRQLNNGSATDTTAASVFSAGTQTGKLEATITPTAVTVYWNGTQVGTVANPFMSAGYPGIISNGPSDMACLAMTVAD